MAKQKNNKSAKATQSLNGKAPSVLEAVGHLGEEIRHLGVKIEAVEHNVTLIAEQFGDVKRTLDSHSQILASHTEMIGKIAIDSSIIKEDVEFIKSSLKKKIDVEEFSAMNPS